ncbi:hypothetical protein ElyMa_004901900 [Elysia marginata]|uniref:Uncharacterized protein n=1 Tax=Elysia marginata TaxID=1093978 RepID=A0AAV4IUJ0_9GAST|nr:hypothetical protein ElyMa_004901900 [Elysia marginata]
MGKIETGLHDSEETVCTKQKKQTERELTRTAVKSAETCFSTFMALKKEKLYTIQAHYRANGVESRIDGNVKRLPATALKHSQIVAVIDFNRQLF